MRAYAIVLLNQIDAAEIFENTVLNNIGIVIHLYSLTSVQLHNRMVLIAIKLMDACMHHWKLCCMKAKDCVPQINH